MALKVEKPNRASSGLIGEGKNNWNSEPAQGRRPWQTLQGFN